MYWNTFHLTVCLKAIFNMYLSHREQTPHLPVHFQYVESTSFLERLVSFAQTGNPKVLPSSFFKQLAVSDTLHQCGWPAFINSLVVRPSSRLLSIKPLYWPAINGELLSSARPTIDYTFGSSFGSVCSRKPQCCCSRQ